MSKPLSLFQFDFNWFNFNFGSILIGSVLIKLPASSISIFIFVFFLPLATMVDQIVAKYIYYILSLLKLFVYLILNFILNFMFVELNITIINIPKQI